ncbi:hypothetical protein MJH12_18750, partial [bacterium]|nr:hypothetical protein [bacterium]
VISASRLIRQTDFSLSIFQKYYFSEGIGLISFQQGLYESGTNNLVGYSKFDLLGYKLGDLQVGNLEGLEGIEFKGVNLEIGLLASNTFQGPYTMKFFQLINATTLPIALEYSVSNSSGTSSSFTTSAYEFNLQAQIVGKLRIPAYSETSHPNGLRVQDNIYKLLVIVEDRNGLIEERTIQIEKFQLDAYWLVDLKKSSDDTPRLNEIDRAVALLDNRNVQDVQSALEIANQMKALSQTIEIQKQGHLIYAITNLVSHLSESPNTDMGLGLLLDKLNFAEIGRNVFDFTSALSKQADGSLTLGDLRGIYDIQVYFTDGQGSLIGALNESIASLEFILENTSNSVDSILIVNLHGDKITFQTKDVYVIKAAMHALSFIVQYFSA